ncbi:MAG: hypothetical protein ABJF23_00550 [Bryobacteraceae bacterium]
MAKEIIEVDCPCCRTTLKIDTVTAVVISHKQPEKPPAIEDLASAVANLKGEAARREEVFQKSFADHNNRKNVLDRKFDELLKQAKSDPDTAPPKRNFDFD